MEQQIEELFVGAYGFKNEDGVVRFNVDCDPLHLSFSTLEELREVLGTSDIEFDFYPTTDERVMLEVTATLP